MIAVVTSCEKDKETITDEFPQRKDIVLTRAEQEVMNSGSDFAFKLFKETFQTITGMKTSIDFMNQMETFNHYSDENLQFCELPFGNEGYCLDILLPKEGKDFADFVKELDFQRLNKCLTNAMLANVKLSVPKIRIAQKRSLVETLMNMGLTLPFYTDADFRNISDESLFINEVLHKTAFDMTEEGAKAAAVTAITGIYGSSGMNPEYKDVSFKADRPFVFVIRETTSKAILFIGTFTGM